MAAALQPGCWRRAGMSASLTGLDTAEVARRLARSLDTGDMSLLAAIESGGLSGHARRASRDATAPGGPQTEDEDDHDPSPRL